MMSLKGSETVSGLSERSAFVKKLDLGSSRTMS